MFKPLLAILLTATQLLAGGGSARYLCISDAGQVCCIDAGPQSCQCCEGLPSDTHRHGDCADAGESAVHEHGLDVGCPTPHQESHATIAGAKCTCIHILISSESAPAVVRTDSRAFTADQISELAAPAVLGWIDTAAPPVAPALPLRWHDPPATAELASLATASVVIRC